MARDNDPFKEFEDLLDEFFGIMENGFDEMESNNRKQNKPTNANSGEEFDVHSAAHKYEDGVRVVFELPHISKSRLNPKCNGVETVLEIEDIGEYAVDMPTTVIPESATARFNNGILTIEYDIAEDSSSSVDVT